MSDLEVKVMAMTMEARRSRMVEISRMAKLGDYSWSFDEYVILQRHIPEEAAALKTAQKRVATAAKARYRRLAK